MGLLVGFFSSLKPIYNSENEIFQNQFMEVLVTYKELFIFLQKLDEFGGT